MKTTDSYAYASKLADIDVKAKVIFAFVPLLFAFLSGSFVVSVVVFVSMTILNMLLGGVKPFILLKYYTVPAAFLIFGSLPVIISGYPTQEGLLFSFGAVGNFYGVTPESLLRGAVLVARAFAALSCVYFLAFNTPINMLFAFFERLKVPQVLLALAELIYRNIFILFVEYSRIKTAQESRLGYSGLAVSFRSFGLLTARIFINSYLRGERIYFAIESRGFDGTFRRFGVEGRSGSKLYILLTPLVILFIGVWVLDSVWQRII